MLNLALSVTPSPSLYPATLEGLRGYFINLIIIARRKLRLRRLRDLSLAMKQRLLCFMVVCYGAQISELLVDLPSHRTVCLISPTPN